MEKVKIYDKLVRDKIPEVIENNGDVAITRIMSDEEYRRELLWKLQEESNEVVNATSREQLIEELADVLEVLKALAKLEDKSMADIIEVAQQKKLIKGGFDKKVFLEKFYNKKKSHFKENQDSDIEMNEIKENNNIDDEESFENKNISSRHGNSNYPVVKKMKIQILYQEKNLMP